MHHLMQLARPAIVATALALAAWAAQADSTSSAASSTSASLGSSSTSLGTSSGSSSKDQVAQGPYTIVEIQALADPAGRVQLRLAPAAAAVAGAPAEITLTLPLETAERARLAVGQVITAEHRSYGLAFATGTAGTRAPFYLVLDDAWFRELASRPVGA